MAKQIREYDIDCEGAGRLGSASVVCARVQVEQAASAVPPSTPRNTVIRFQERNRRCRIGIIEVLTSR